MKSERAKSTRDIFEEPGRDPCFSLRVVVE